MNSRRVGVIGATSMVGKCLLPLLVNGGCDVVAFTRKEVAEQRLYAGAEKGVVWQNINDPKVINKAGQPSITDWICLAPIWTLPDYRDLLVSFGAKRLVALSSTSRYTKSASSDGTEREVAARLSTAETQLSRWAGEKGVQLTILQPTMIYGLGQDRNISDIARFIQRFGFFPLFGPAKGLRQPLYAGDVAEACYLALKSPLAAGRTYTLSGGEVLPYHEMVRRIFVRLGKPTRIIRLPLWLFRLGIRLARYIPGYAKLTPAMAERMNQDLLFSHDEAVRDFGFAPRPFELDEEDLPG